MTDLEDARKAIGVLMRYFPEQMGGDVTKVSLVETGEMIYPHSYMGVETEDAMELNLHTHIDRLKVTNPKRALFLKETFKIPDNKIIFPGAARWYGLGLPCYRLLRDTLLAASTMKLEEENLGNITPPSAAFYIDLPSDLVMVEDFGGNLTSATGVLVHVVQILKDAHIDGKVLTAGPKWRYVILTDTATIQWQFNRTLSELCNIGVPGRANNWKNITSYQLSDYDHKVNSMVSRIICGICLLAPQTSRFEESKELVKFPRGSSRLKKADIYYTVYTEKTDG